MTSNTSKFVLRYGSSKYYLKKQTMNPLVIFIHQVQFVDVICHNHYYGWYENSGHYELIQLQAEYDIREWFDKFQKPYIQSEYGAGAVAGLHMASIFSINVLT